MSALVPGPRLTAQIAVMGTWKDPSLLLKMSWNCFVASILYEDRPLCSALSLRPLS